VASIVIVLAGLVTAVFVMLVISGLCRGSLEREGWLDPPE
jgi:hypothetical protein